MNNKANSKLGAWKTVFVINETKCEKESKSIDPSILKEPLGHFYTVLVSMVTFRSDEM